MKRFLILIFVFLIKINCTAYCQIPAEWELAEQLIENYNNGTPSAPVAANLESVSVQKIYYYVYSVIPERLNVKSSTKNQVIWLEMRENQNNANSISAAEEINKHILTDNMTELEKIAAIHNWILFNTEFDSQTASTATAITNENIWAFCADGVFTRGRAVCSGYAAAFKIMCQDAGIPCFSINSNVKNHTWNVVYYDGAWRFIDVSSESRFADDLGIYKYFMLNENELPAKTHQLDDAGKATLSTKEYMGFFSFHSGKCHSFEADSVHGEVLEFLASRQNAVSELKKFMLPEAEKPAE